MPPRKVRDPSGQIVEVEAPAGASNEDIIRLAKEQRHRPAPSFRTATPAAPRPDIVGRAKEWLTREPALGEHTLMGETDLPGRVVRSVGDLFLPRSKSEAAAFAATLPIGGGLVTGPLKRTAASAIAGTLADWVERGKVDWNEAYRFAASQGLGEVLPAWLRFGLTQRAGQPLVRKAEEVASREAAAYKEALPEYRKAEAGKIREARAQHQERVAAAKRAHAEAEAEQRRRFEAETQQVKDANAAAKQSYEASEIERTRQFESKTRWAKDAHAEAVREYGAQGAKIIADSYKEHVPSWKEFPSTEAGLVDMVYGRGPERLSAMYDPVMQEVGRQGRGMTVEIPLADAQALKIRNFDVRDTGVRGREMARVQADQLAEAVVGKGKDLPGVYRRAVAAVDGITLDPAWAPRRAEYKAGMSLIQFTDKSQMLKGRRFNPDAAESGFTMLKKVDELRRRGMGSAVEGPIAEATSRPRPTLRLPSESAPLPAARPLPLPAEPTPLSPPTFEAFRRPPAGTPPTPPAGRVLPPGVTTRKLPQISFWEGAAIAELPFLIEAVATGRTQHLYVPWAVGGLMAHGLSGKELITGAPLSAASRFAERVLPPAMAQEVRKTVLPPPVPLELTNTYRP